MRRESKRTEPATENQLFGLNNINLTPHIAASTSEAQIIVAESGEIIGYENFQKKIVLNRGKIINTENNNQGIINFSKFD